MLEQGGDQSHMVCWGRLTETHGLINKPRELSGFALLSCSRQVARDKLSS